MPDVPYFVLKDAEGKPRAVADITAALQESITKADKDRERLEGTLTSKIALLGANFVWLVLHDMVPRNATENISWPDSPDEQWTLVRNFMVSSLGKDKLTPSINSLMPMAIRAGMLLAGGHVRVLRFPWGASLGDEAFAEDKQGGVERIAAPYNTVKPEFVEKGGGKKKERRQPNMADHFTCLNAKHITELWHAKIGKEEMEINSDGLIARKRAQRQPGGAVAGNGQPGGTPGNNVVNLEKPTEVFANLVPMFDTHRRELANTDMTDEALRLSFAMLKALDKASIAKDDAFWNGFNALLTEMLEVNEKYNPDKIEAAD
jgi:hypothetical protein